MKQTVYRSVGGNVEKALSPQNAFLEWVDEYFTGPGPGAPVSLDDVIVFAEGAKRIRLDDLFEMFEDCEDVIPGVGCYGLGSTYAQVVASLRAQLSR